MIQDPATLHKLTVGASVFVLVLALWLEVVLIWSRLRSSRLQQLDERLRPGKEGDPSKIRVLRLWREAKSPAAGGAPRQPRLLASLDRLVRQAGWGVSGRFLLVVTVGLAGLVFLVTFALTERVLPALATAAAGPLLFHMYVRARISRRAALFDRQLLDALQMIAGSLRAGHPLGGAFRFVSVEIGAPVGDLFGEMCQEQSLGVSLEAAIRKVADKSTSPDMKMFAASVVVQLRSGGNLADMMERLASVMRDRIRVNRRLRVLTAQTQFSKRILLALPFLIFVVLTLLNPDYLEPLYSSTTGKMVSVVAVVGLLIGAWVMNRMAVVRY